MQILVISPDLPFPPTSGGKIKSYHMLKHICLNYKVTIASVLKGEDVYWIDEFKAEFPAQEYIFANVDCPRTPVNLLQSYLRQKTLNEYRTWSESFFNQLQPHLAKADCIIADHYEVMQYIPPEYNNKVVLHTHNAEHMIWKRFAQLDQSWWKKLVLLTESSRIANKERVYCNQVKRVLASSNDRDALTEIGVPRNKFRPTYHLGDETQLQLKELEWNSSKPLILFIGTLTWEANVDGLLWFLENCWQTIKNDHPDIRFVIGGKYPDHRLLEWAAKDPAIELPGFIEDPEVYFLQARVFIVPLRFGSGMKVKVLNAMYRGIPTVTTDIGVEGLEVQNGIHMAIASKPEEFIAQVERLLTDQEHWEELKTYSRSLARHKYTWNKVYHELDKAIADVNQETKRKNFPDTVTPLWQKFKGITLMYKQ